MTSTMRAVSLACESIYSRSPVINSVEEPQRWWRDVCTISVSTAHDYLKTWFSLFPSRKTVAPGWLICQLWCQNTIIRRLRFPVNFSSSPARNQPLYRICRRWNLTWFIHNTIPWLNENVLNMNNRKKTPKQGGMSPLISKQELIFTTLMVVEPPPGCESDWDNGKEQPHPTPHLTFVFVSRLQNFNQQNFPTQHKLFLSDPSPNIGYACQ